MVGVDVIGGDVVVVDVVVVDVVDEATPHAVRTREMQAESAAQLCFVLWMALRWPQISASMRKLAFGAIAAGACFFPGSTELCFVQRAAHACLRRCRR